MNENGPMYQRTRNFYAGLRAGKQSFHELPEKFRERPAGKQPQITGLVSESAFAEFVRQLGNTLT